MSRESPSSTPARLTDGSINNQSIWRYLREKGSADPDMLHSTAIIDCTRSYSYAELFHEWGRYARVFSALGMTEQNHARVGIAGSISAEPLFAFYALNMVGATVSMLSYPDFLPTGMWRTMVERERLTDLVLSDIMLTPEQWPALQTAGRELGLRNIILLHSRLGGPCCGPAELGYNEVNFHRLCRLPGVRYMEALADKYADTPISYGSDDADHIALISHTSGTTKGTRKPLPFTERAINMLATKTYEIWGGDALSMHPSRLAPSFDFSSLLCMGGLIHSGLANGRTVVLTFFGFLHPKFIRAAQYYRLDTLFTSGFMIDSWMQRTDLDGVDLSCVKWISCGGSYLPPDKLRKYTAFLRSLGYQGHILRAYGMSETGDAQLVVPPGCEDDILGFPDSVDSFRIQDENDGRFYRPDEGARTGVLYATSASHCLNELDGEELFPFTPIDGRDFICTNDLVRVNADGCLSYAGRANRFFVNNEGIRFEAGLVETCISRQPGIDKCAVVPVLDKRIHDTVPVLYVVPVEQGEAGVEAVRRAIAAVFVRDELLKRSSLPAQCVLVDSIPCNANGKLDIYRLTRERLHGQAYNILPVHAQEDGSVTDISVELVEQLNSITGGVLPEGMEERSALGLYELLNAPQKAGRPLFPPPSIVHFLKNQQGDRHTMFDFFDTQKNPFMAMLNPDAAADEPQSVNTAAQTETEKAMDPMQFMQQAFQMQMQMAQMMWMMPFQFMQGMSMMSKMNAPAETQTAPAAQPAGFKLGGLTVPPELLNKLMSMEMTPENLEKLQKMLDFVFAAMPDKKDD